MSRVTPKHAYYRPILEALVEFGGTEETDTVCRRVYEKVQATLTSADLETTKTPPYEAKWRNHTRWARNEMVAQGLLSGGKLHGWWKITDIGRKWLSAQKRKDRAQRPRKTRRLSVTVVRGFLHLQDARPPRNVCLSRESSQSCWTNGRDPDRRHSRLPEEGSGTPAFFHR